MAYEGDAEGVYPVVEYEDSSGAGHRVQLSCSEGPPVGAALDIIYDPARPDRAIGNNFVHLWLFPIVFGGIGGMVVVIAVLAWLGVMSFG